MIQILLIIFQPLTVIGFLISGICYFILAFKNNQLWNLSIINLGLAVVNLFIFYGNKIFK